MSEQPHPPSDPTVPCREDADPGPVTVTASDAVLPPPGGCVPLPWAGARYRLLDLIGRGGMGCVWRGHDPALNRDLAVKVLADPQDRADLRRRFLEEAQIGGQLQHPGVVPVYEVGCFPDGRPYFTMKLVRGETLAVLLRRRASPADDLPRFLQVFEQVCQTVAYAHSRGVIHRDLKPANVMVGAFGEVQLMDWGLAKVLSEASGGRQPPDGPLDQGADASRSPHANTDRTQVGAVLGTPAYMAPEQARGQTDRVDERADVFGLGAILCEVLTGQPPYGSTDATTVFRRAVAGDLADARRRLESCGADPELTAVAMTCLSADPSERPRHAGAVADRVTAYRVGVQERLRAAEVARAAAVVREQEAQRRAAVEAREKLTAQQKARAERLARRLTVGLAAVILLALTAGGGGAFWVERQQADRRARIERRTAEVTHAVAADLRDAEQAERRGDWEAARAGLARADARLPADGFDALRDRVRQADADLALVARLDEVRSRKVSIIEGKYDVASARRDYPAVLAAHGFDVLHGDPARVADRVRRSAIREPLLRALDDWASVLHRPRWYQLGRRDRVLRVAACADDNALRNRFRALWRQGDDSALRELADSSDPATLAPASVEVLARALPAADQVPFLTRAQRCYPGDFWLNFELANRLNRADPPRHEEAVGYYRAALAARPTAEAVWNNLGGALLDCGRRDEAEAAFRAALRLRPDYAAAASNLGGLLCQEGKPDEGEKVCRDAVRMEPKLALAHFKLGFVLAERKKWAEAEKADREAIRLKPDFCVAWNNLGVALNAQGKHAEAEKAYRKAIALNGRYELARRNLGALLRDRGRLDEAESAYREAVRLKPADFAARFGLGLTLVKGRRWADAEDVLRDAVRLDPKSAAARYQLGCVLGERNQWPEAEAADREAVRLKPDDAEAWNDLANALCRQKKYPEAEKACRESLRLRPAYALARYNLGVILQDQRRFGEAAAAFRAALRLDPNLAPADLDLGKVLCQTGHDAEAETAFREAVRLRPGDPVAHFDLGLALQLQQKWPEAIRSYRQATRLKADDAAAWNNLGNVLGELGQWPDAEEAYRNAVHFAPDQPLTYANLARALRAEGRLDQAEEVCREAVRLNPSFALARERLGDVLRDQGHLGEAEAAYREAIRLAPRFAEAHRRLGVVLCLEGRFADGLASLFTGVREAEH